MTPRGGCGLQGRRPALAAVTRRPDAHDQLTFPQTGTPPTGPGPRTGTAGTTTDQNCWTLAEYAGDNSPDGMQDLLTRVKWNDREVRADVRDFVTAQLGDPDGILIVDETGDLNKG